MATPIDVLILIALTEEARTFYREGFYPLKEQPNLESFPYHAFEYIDDGGHQRTGIFVVAGEIGPRIRDAALVFAREYPHLSAPPIGAIMMSNETPRTEKLAMRAALSF